MRRKIFENKIVRKSIVWAMTFMMAFSSVGGSLTVFAEEAVEEKSSVDEFKDSGYESDADLYKHMENISLYGGVSGAITSLIYHFDISNVFRQYFESILNYLNERDIVITDLTVDNLIWTCYELIVDDILA